MRKSFFAYAVIVTVLLTAFLLPPLFGLTVEQQRTLLLLILAIILWSSEVLPTGISALWIIGLEMALGVSDSFASAVQGFLYSSLYFILVVALIGSTITKVGLDKQLAAFIVHAARGKLHRVAQSVFVATVLLPLIMPSGNARVQMFVPLVEQIGKSYPDGQRIPFQRFSIWTLSGVNQLATVSVLSGGGFAVLASQLAVELDVKTDWLHWLLLMAPPIWLACLGTGLVMWRYWKIAAKTSAIAEMNVAPQAAKTQDNKSFWIVSFSLAALIITWIAVPNLPIILPPLLLVGLFAMPGIGLLDNRDLRNYDWENFILLGTALSLAFTIEQNGTADWLVGLLLSLLGPRLPEWLYVVVLLVVTIAIRMLFTTPPAALTALYPLVKSYALWTGLNPAHSFLLAVMVSVGTVILPIHSPIMYFAYKTGHLPFRQHLFVSIAMLFCTMLAGLGAYWFYWPWIS